MGTDNQHTAGEMPGFAEACARIERIMADDPRGRGIGALVQPGALATAATLLFALAGEGAEIWVISGFYLPVPQAPETDGPPGAQALAVALRALGANPLHVTDAPHLALYRAMGTEALDATDTEQTPAPWGRAAALVAIERPGRAADGRYLSMSARDVTPHTAPLDRWFLERPPGGPPTIAIGDGGNEIGMGNVRDLVMRDVPHGEAIASVVPCDHLLVAGVSNFGAYGLVAALSLLAGRDLLPTAAQAEADIMACVGAGACDGHTFENAPSVDGLPVAASLDFLRALRQIQ